MLTSTILALVPALSSVAPQSILVDFGDPALPAGVQADVWNDIHTQNQIGSHALLDSTGAPTGLQLDFQSNELLGRIQVLGTQVPAPGSALETLGWPVEAISDGMYAGVTPEKMEARFTLYGVDPTSSIDLTFLASQLGGTDLLATKYTATGANQASVVHEPAGNKSEVATLTGIRPDALGAISIRVASATTNTSNGRDFFLNAMRIEVHPAGTQPPRVRFTTNRVDASRVQEKGPFSGWIDLYTNDLTTPTVNLFAFDGATSLPPTWLSVPASAVPGQPFELNFDPGGVGVGTHTATVFAEKTGYKLGVLKVTLRVRTAGPLNLLYYGNSWTALNGGYPAMIEELAVELGYEMPDSVLRLPFGKQMKFHANNGGQIAAISELIPLGEEWDWVLALGSSYDATASKGKPAFFESNVIQIVTNVRAHSPGARMCLLQPWARAVGHIVYQGPSPAFASPLDLRAEIEAGYESAATGANQVHGPDTVVRAFVGGTLWLQAFDPALYGPDGAHPGPKMTVAAATTVFAVLYGDLACRMKLDFQTPAAFVTNLANLGLGEPDWPALAGLSDRVAAPDVRNLPGSGDELLLTTGSGGVLDACWLEKLEPGNVLDVRVHSPNGVYDGASTTIYVDTFPKGSRPSPNLLRPELHFKPESAWAAASATGLASGGLTAQVTIQPWMVGKTLIVQAVALAPSQITGRPFTATDGHEIRVGTVSMLPPRR